MRFISQEPKSEIVTMTREIVDDLLSRNTKNRNVRKGWVQYLAQEIASGQWYLTNQGIGVHRDGTVIDGQHRLLALREENYPAVRMNVVWGLPDTAMKAIDLGIKRTLSDILDIAFGCSEASAAKVAVARSWGRFVEKNAESRPHPQLVYAWFKTVAEETEKLFSCATDAHKCPAPIVAAMVWAIKRDGPEKPVEFFQRFWTGTELQASSPELKLRNWYFANKGGGGGASPLSTERFKRTLTAYQAYSEGRTIDKLYSRNIIPDVVAS